MVQVRVLDDAFCSLDFNICEIRTFIKFRLHVIFNSLTTNFALIEKPGANQFI